MWIGVAVMLRPVTCYDRRRREAVGVSQRSRTVSMGFRGDTWLPSEQVAHAVGSWSTKIHQLVYKPYPRLAELLNQYSTSPTELISLLHNATTRSPTRKMPSYRPFKSSDLSTHHTTSSRASTSAHATSTASAGAPTNITISPAHRRACESAMERGRASALAEQKEKDEAASEIFEDLTKDTGSDHTRAFEEYCETHDLDPLTGTTRSCLRKKRCLAVTSRTSGPSGTPSLRRGLCPRMTMTSLAAMRAWPPAVVLARSSPLEGHLP